MQSHDLERVRRSLAMSPSLPSDVALELVESLRRILADGREIVQLAAELERIAAELRRLAP